MRKWSGNGERMRNWKERGNGDRKMKWRKRWEMETERDFLTLHFTPIYLNHQNFPIFSKKNCLSKDIISYKGMPTIIAGLLYLTPKEDDWKWVEIVFFVDSVYLIYSACFMTQPCLTHIWTIWDLIGTKDQMARITLYQLFWASSPLHPSSL